MIVTTEFVDLPAEQTAMRTFVARPKAEGAYPGLILYSDIFQLTASMRRAAVRFASYGFVVAAPEIYHRFETPGHALDFEADYQLAQDVDADVHVLIDFLGKHPGVGGRPLHASGFCLGGHLAFRAALQPRIRSTVCFYPTGLESGELGGDAGVDTLARCGEIRGALLLVVGTADPHLPVAGRRAIDDALRQANARYLISEYDGQHAFMRDEGPRYDPAETDRAMLEAVMFLQQHG
jgi:carboxymethylenebutenolidase